MYLQVISYISIKLAACVLPLMFKQSSGTHCVLSSDVDLKVGLNSKQDVAGRLQRGDLIDFSPARLRGG